MSSGSRGTTLLGTPMTDKFPEKIAPMPALPALPKVASPPLNERSSSPIAQMPTLPEVASPPVTARSASPLASKTSSPLAPRSASPLAPRSSSPLALRSSSPLAQIARAASPFTERNSSPLAQNPISMSDMNKGHGDASAPRKSSRLRAADLPPTPTLPSLNVGTAYSEPSSPAILTNDVQEEQTNEQDEEPEKDDDGHRFSFEYNPEDDEPPKLDLPKDIRASFGSIPSFSRPMTLRSKPTSINTNIKLPEELPQAYRPGDPGSKMSTVVRERPLSRETVVPELVIQGMDDDFDRQAGTSPTPKSFLNGVSDWDAPDRLSQEIDHQIEDYRSLASPKSTTHLMSHRNSSNFNLISNRTSVASSIYSTNSDDPETPPVHWQQQQTSDETGHLNIPNGIRFSTVSSARPQHTPTQSVSHTIPQPQLALQDRVSTPSSPTLPLEDFSNSPPPSPPKSPHPRLDSPLPPVPALQLPSPKKSPRYTFDIGNIYDSYWRQSVALQLHNFDGERENENGDEIVEQRRGRRRTRIRLGDEEEGAVF
ncbi:MAG: hypothetical protein MMC33_003752 [Icmadophila ericetorum]|nr:hypothetical protein [Icmadophila ericetorum]